MDKDLKIAVSAFALAGVLLAGAVGLAVWEGSDVSETRGPVVVEAPLPVPPPAVVPREDRFPTVIARVLVHEGGATYTNHPADPGGPTKYGITIWDVRKWINPNATASDVKNLTKEKALDIYRKAYWNVVHGAELPVGVDYVVADYSINAGVGRGSRALRRSVGLGDVGGFTPDLLAAVKRQDPRVTIAMVSQDRMTFQMGLPKKYNVFKKGWKRRIEEVQAQAIRDLDTNRVVKGVFSDHMTVHPAPGKAPSIREE